MPDSTAPTANKRVSSSTKRASVAPSSAAPAAPKPPCNIDSGATIAAQAVLGGLFPVTIKSGAILHPYANISSMHGPVEIGERAVIWERAVVGAEDGEGETIIGKDVVIDTGAKIEVGAVIGDGSVIECYAVIKRGAKVGKFCKVVPYAVVPIGDSAEDYTVIYGNGARRRMDSTTRDRAAVAESRRAAHHKQVRGLQALIPSNIAKWQ